MARAGGLQICSAQEPFTTIDDILDIAKELIARLVILGQYKYPLAVRRGVGSMNEDRQSSQVRAGSRTYFFDVEKTSEGNKYLRITESRFIGEGKDRERNAIVVFPEHAGEFLSTVSEMVKKLE
jgi:hypothetical protein